LNCPDSSSFLPSCLLKSCIISIVVLRASLVNVSPGFSVVCLLYRVAVLRGGESEIDFANCLEGWFCLWGGRWFLWGNVPAVKIIPNLSIFFVCCCFFGFFCFVCFVLLCFVLLLSYFFFVDFCLFVCFGGRFLSSQGYSDCSRNAAILTGNFF